MLLLCIAMGNREAGKEEIEGEEAGGRKGRDKRRRQNSGRVRGRYDKLLTDVSLYLRHFIIFIGEFLKSDLKEN